MTPKETVHIENWKQGALATATAELASGQKEYATRSIADFNTLTGMIANKARIAFMEEFGIMSAEDFNAIPDEIKGECTTRIVSALNEALPADHPYIVAFVYSDQTPQLRMCSMQRKSIPGWHDIVSRNIVPILRIRNSPIGESGGFHFTAEDVEYICS